MTDRIVWISVAVATFLSTSLFPAIGFSQGARTHYTVRFQARYSSKSLKEMAFSPDGSQLAVSLNSDRVRLVDTKSGNLTGILAINKYSRPFAMSFSQSGRRLYMISTRNRHLVDIANNAERKTDLKQIPGDIGIRYTNRNGKLIITQIDPGGPVAANPKISVGDEIVAIAEGPGGDNFYQTNGSPTVARRYLPGPAGTFLRLKVIPKGMLEDATHLIERQQVSVVEGRNRFAPLPPAKITNKVVWCLYNHRHQFCDASTGREVSTFRLRDIENRCHQHAISPDSKRFAALAPFNTNRRKIGIEVYDIGLRKRLHLVEFPGETYSSMVFSANGKKLLIGTFDSVEVFDLESGQFEATRKLSKNADGRAGQRLVGCLAASPNDVFATGDPFGRVRIWELGTGRELLAMPVLKDEKQRIEKIRFTPDGEWLAYYVRGVLHLVDVSDVKPKTAAADKD